MWQLIWAAKSINWTFHNFLYSNRNTNLTSTKKRSSRQKVYFFIAISECFRNWVYFPQKLPLVTLAHSRRVFLAATDSPESLGIILCLRDAISARDVDGFPWSVIGNTDPKYITCGPLELAACTGEDADVMLRVFTHYSRPVGGVNGHIWVGEKLSPLGKGI